jgi:hypothetical protein
MAPPARDANSGSSLQPGDRKVGRCGSMQSRISGVRKHADSAHRMMFFLCEPACGRGLRERARRQHLADNGPEVRMGLCVERALRRRLERLPSS